jgi:hypothetical protein
MSATKKYGHTADCQYLANENLTCDCGYAWQDRTQPAVTPPEALTGLLERVREKIARDANFGPNTTVNGVMLGDLRALCDAVERMAAERDALRADAERLAIIADKQLSVSSCDACEREGEYRINVCAPSGAGHCNSPTLDGLRSGIDAALTLNPKHFARAARSSGTGAG